jgi:hypothetical protein
MRRFGTADFFFMVLILIFVFGSRALAFHYSVVISLAMFFMTFLKVVIHFPRPYQIHPDLMPLALQYCSAQYGSPSSSGIRVSFMMTTIFLDAFYGRRHIIHPFMLAFGFILTQFINMCVLISRVYWVQHTIDQIIYGALLGIYISIYLHFSVKPAVYRHLIKLQNKSPSYTNYPKLIRKAVGLFLLTQIVSFVAYWYVEEYTTINQIYLQNLMRKCDRPANINPNSKAFPSIGTPVLALGAYLGILMQHRFLMLYNRTNQTIFWKSACRLLLVYFGIVYFFVA